MHESIILEIRTLLMKLRSPWGNSLVVKWLGLHVSIARGMGSIPGQETEILKAACCGQKKKGGQNQDSNSGCLSPESKSYCCAVMRTWIWPAWAQEGLGDGWLKDCLSWSTERALQPPLCPHPSHLDKEDLCLHPSPWYDFIFLFNEDKNHHHKSQEKGIFAPHSQAVQKMSAVLGQRQSFLHGAGWGRGHSAQGHHSGRGSSFPWGTPGPVERWAVRTPLSIVENK